MSLLLLSAEEVAARVYLESPRWCEGRSYVWMVVRSGVGTALGHLAVRCVADARGWRPRGLALDWDSRVVSTVNAVLAVRAYVLLGDFDLGSSYDAVVVADCARDGATLSLAGYLLFDLLVCLYARDQRKSAPGGYDDPLVLAHHLVVAVAFLVGVASRLATAYMAALLLNECSTPFVNIRAFINAHWPPPRPRTSTPQILYLINGLFLLATYFFCRIAWTLRILLHVAFAWRDLWQVGLIIGGHRLLVVVCLSFLLLGHLLINCLWFTHILSHVRRQLTGNKSNKLKRDDSSLHTKGQQNNGQAPSSTRKNNSQEEKDDGDVSSNNDASSLAKPRQRRSLRILKTNNDDAPAERK